MGHVSHTSELGHMLLDLNGRRRSGQLEVRQGVLRHSIHLHEGMISGACVEGEFHPLGRILVQQGKLSRANLHRSLERMATSERLQGQLLCELGALAPGEVDAALKIQTEQRVIQLMRLRAVKLAVRPWSGSRPAALLPSIHPFSALRSFVQRLPASALGRLEGHLGSRTLGLTSTGSLPWWLLNPDETRAARTLRRTTTPGALAATWGKDRPSLMRFLLILSTGGLLTTARGEQGRRRGAASGAIQRGDRTGDASRLAARILGVRPAASHDQLRRAFVRQARRYHPDRHPHATTDQRRRLGGRFAQVSEAYTLLCAEAAGRGTDA